MLFNLIARCENASGKFAALRECVQRQHADETSPKSFDNMGMQCAQCNFKLGQRNRTFVRQIFEFRCSSAKLTALDGASVTTLLVFGAAIIIIALILVIVGFVFIIMSEDDKAEIPRGRSNS